MRRGADARLTNWSLPGRTISCGRPELAGRSRLLRCWPMLAIFRTCSTGQTRRAGVRLPARLSRSARLRHLEPGAALHLTDQRADVVVGRALKDRVLVDEARRLADPHRHAQLLALRDGEIDILHQDMHCGSVAERAIQYR